MGDSDGTAALECVGGGGGGGGAGLVMDNHSRTCSRHSTPPGRSHGKVTPRSPQSYCVYSKVTPMSQ